MSIDPPFFVYHIVYLTIGSHAARQCVHQLSAADFVLVLVTVTCRLRCENRLGVSELLHAASLAFACLPVCSSVGLVVESLEVSIGSRQGGG